MENSEVIRTIRGMLDKDRRYSFEAYRYLVDRLLGDKVVGSHVKTKDLLKKFKETGIKDFGPLAGMVFEDWGLRSTEDIGNVLRNLVDHRFIYMNANDDFGDFRDGYDFREAFNVFPIFGYNKDRDEWSVSYIDIRYKR